MVYSSRDTFIIPKKLQNRNSSKPSMEATLVLKRCSWGPSSLAFWPKITEEILQTGQSWKVYQTFSGNLQRENLMPLEVPEGSWEKIGADFFEFESTNYLQIAHYYSWFPIIRRMKSTQPMPQVMWWNKFSAGWCIKHSDVTQKTTVFIEGVQSICKPLLLWPYHIKCEVPTEQWHDRMNGMDSEAVPKEMHGNRTWSLPSYVYLQGKSTCQQPTSTSRTAELKEIHGLTTNNEPDTECPQTEC